MVYLPKVREQHTNKTTTNILDVVSKKQVDRADLHRHHIDKAQAKTYRIRTTSKIIDVVGGEKVSRADRLLCVTDELLGVEENFMEVCRAERATPEQNNSKNIDVTSNRQALKPGLISARIKERSRVC